MGIRTAGMAAATSFFLAAATAGPAAAHPGPLPWPGVQHVRVDAAATGTPFPRALAGVVTGPDPVTATNLAPLTPGIVREDAYLQDLWDCDSGWHPDALAALDARIGAAQAAGGDVLFSVEYMPPCIAKPGLTIIAGPDKRPAADPARFRALVAELAHHLVSERIARGEAPVTRWEVWNEPDNPVFWAGTLSEFAAGVWLPALQGVASEEAASGVHLDRGGCSCATPDSGYLDNLLAVAAAAGERVDFVSWHWYGNFPFLGPDGMEPVVGAGFAPIYRLLAHRNPFATPAAYERQARAFATRYPGKRLIVSEWNLSSGGFDVRMDTEEGAAFVAASLVSMARGGLDAATVYRLEAAFDVPGDWGVVASDGTRQPQWYALRTWTTMGDTALPVVTSSLPDQSGIWTAAGRDAAGRVTLLAASFSALWPHTHTLDVVFVGLAPGPHVMTHGDGTAEDVVAGTDGELNLQVPLGANSWTTLTLD